MKRSSPRRQRLAALSLLAFPLLTYPVLGLPNGKVADIPVIYLYLFGVWGVFILLAAMVAEGKGK